MEKNELASKNPNCSFCDYKKEQFPHFKRYGQGDLDRYVIAQTDHFSVKSDILPGNPDGRHILVHPKAHVYNHAVLGRYANEVGALVYQLEQRMGPLVTFEHGGLKPGNSIQSIYHAHFHAYGGLDEIDVIGYMADMLSGGLSSDEIYPFEIVPAPDYTFISNLEGRFNGIPYLYVEQGPWGLIAEDPKESMRSQITQRSMHKFFSGQELDWKQIPQNEEFAKESVRRIKNLVEFCQSGQYNTHIF